MRAVAPLAPPPPPARPVLAPGFASALASGAVPRAVVTSADSFSAPAFSRGASRAPSGMPRYSLLAAAAFLDARGLLALAGAFVTLRSADRRLRRALSFRWLILRRILGERLLSWRPMRAR